MDTLHDIATLCKITRRISETETKRLQMFMGDLMPLIRHNGFAGVRTATDGGDSFLSLTQTVTTAKPFCRVDACRFPLSMMSWILQIHSFHYPHDVNRADGSEREVSVAVPYKWIITFKDYNLAALPRLLVTGTASAEQLRGYVVHHVALSIAMRQGNVRRVLEGLGYELDITTMTTSGYLPVVTLDRKLPTARLEDRMLADLIEVSHTDQIEELIDMDAVQVRHHPLEYFLHNVLDQGTTDEFNEYMRVHVTAEDVVKVVQPPCRVDKLVSVGLDNADHTTAPGLAQTRGSFDEYLQTSSARVISGDEYRIHQLSQGTATRHSPSPGSAGDIPGRHGAVASGTRVGARHYSRTRWWFGLLILATGVLIAGVFIAYCFRRVTSATSSYEGPGPVMAPRNTTAVANGPEPITMSTTVRPMSSGSDAPPGVGISGGNDIICPVIPWLHEFPTISSRQLHVSGKTVTLFEDRVVVRDRRRGVSNSVPAEATTVNCEPNNRHCELRLRSLTIQVKRAPDCERLVKYMKWRREAPCKR